MLRLLTAVSDESTGFAPEPAAPPTGPSRPEAVRPPRRPEVG